MCGFKNSLAFGTSPGVWSKKVIKNLQAKVYFYSGMKKFYKGNHCTIIIGYQDFVTKIFQKTKTPAWKSLKAEVNSIHYYLLLAANREFHEKCG